MLSRERVLTAIQHREPDRVPVSFGDIVFSSIFDYPPYGYRALCDYLGIDGYPEPISSPDGTGTVLNVDERLRQRLRGDLRWLSAGSSRPAEYLPDGGVRDDWGLVRYRTGPYWDLRETEAPLRGARDASDLDRYASWPDPSDPAIARGKREEAMALRDAGFAVVAVPNMAQAIFHNYAFLRGFEQWLIDIHEDRRFFHAFSERLTDWAISYLEAFLGPIADVIDIVMMGEDLGTQEAPFMSPQDYRNLLKPYHARWTAAVKHVAPEAKIALHSCGSILPIIPDLIEIGVDILNPVQPRARSMEPWRLKREFGDALSFLGGVDIQELLPHGTPQQVRDGVRELIDTYAPGGGFILAPSHQFQSDVPPANIVAMYDSAFDNGSYPLRVERL